MNVFILGTGRCGSYTLIEACKNITNYSSGHESLARKLGEERFNYPENHIEADNRLSWLLGGLNEKYGDSAFYIHLKRDREKTARSFLRRYDYRRSMINAYSEGIKMTLPEVLNKEKRLAFCRDYVDTVTSNIDFFLANKTKTMEINLETIQEDFQKMWKEIGAEGDLAVALDELANHHNASGKKVINLKYMFLYPFLRIWKRLTIKS